MSCAAGVHKFPKKKNLEATSQIFGHQKGDTKQVLYTGPLVLERPVDLIFIYCSTLGAWELTQFLYIRKKLQ